MAGGANADEWTKSAFGVDPKSFGEGTVGAAILKGMAQANGHNAAGTAPPAGDNALVRAALAGLEKGRIEAQGQKELADKLRYLEGMHPADGHPGQYATRRDGKDVLVAAVDGETAVAAFQASLKQRIDVALAVSSTVEEVFAGKQAKGITQKMAAFFIDDDVTRLAEGTMNALVGQARGNLSGALMLNAARKFAAAVERIAQAEVQNHRAFQCIDTWQGEVGSKGGQIVTVLTVVKEVSFEFDKIAAKVVFTPLGGKVAGAVLDTVQTGAEIAGEAAAGQEIDWREKCIDLAVKLVIDLASGGASEDMVKKQVMEVAEKQLAKRISAAEVPAIAEAIAETVWSRIESVVGDATAKSIKDVHAGSGR